MRRRVLLIPGAIAAFSLGLGSGPVFALDDNQVSDADRIAEEVQPDRSRGDELQVGPSVLPVGSDVPPPESRQTEEEALEVLAEMESDPFNWEHRDYTDAIMLLNERYSDVASRLYVDSEARTIHVSYYSGATDERIEEYIAAAKEATATSAYPVEIHENSYNEADQMATLERIAESAEEYSDQFGGLPAVITAEHDGSIYVRLHEGREVPLNTEVNGFKVYVDDSPSKGQPQTRAVDWSPWKGGARASNGLSHCTLGWAWTRWADGKRYGSTARHCGGGTFTNNLSTSSAP